MPIVKTEPKKDFLDLTKLENFQNLEIRKDVNDNYYLHNQKENWSCKYFLLCSNKVSYTQVEISFSEFNNEFLPKFKFSRHKIKDISIQNLRKDVSKDKIALVDLNKDGSDNFWKLIGVISKLKNVDLKNFQRHKIVESEKVLEVNDQNIKTLVQQIINKNYSKEVLEEIVKQNVNLADDLGKVAIQKKREKSLETFRKLLEEDYIQTYKSEIMEKPTTKDEIAWQHFFEKNEWIFGYGLDYRFQGILQKEYSASNPQASGKGEVKGDFLLGDNKFTTFVELKKPDTKLFGKSTNRANAWKLSEDLLDGYSQILEQKSSGQIKYEKGDLYDENGNKITQKAYDSKTILIIGNWREVENCNDLEKEIKEKTFELFRRDSRNVEILTYDELYERAKFIVNGK